MYIVRLFVNSKWLLLNVLVYLWISFICLLLNVGKIWKIMNLYQITKITNYYRKFIL